MKNTGKIIVVSVIIVVIILAAVFLVLGGKMSSVYVSDFEVTEDGRVIVLEAGVASSAGYIRSADTRKDDGKLYVTFYRTFGVNNSVGAKTKFPIEVDGCTEVYIWRGEEAGFVKMLVFENGEWGFVE